MLDTQRNETDRLKTQEQARRKTLEVANGEAMVRQKFVQSCRPPAGILKSAADSKRVQNIIDFVMLKRISP
jgi:hypothetical protein